MRAPDRGAVPHAGRWWWAAAAAGFSLVVTINLATVTDAWKLLPDNCYYMNLARSLANGQGYRYQGTPHTCFPPGWPAVLAAAIGAGLRSWAALRAVSAVLAVLAATAAFFVARQRVGRWAGLAVAVLFGVSPHLIVLGPLLYSDIPYAFWSLLGLCAAGALARREKPRHLLTVAAGAGAALAALTRSVGLCLGVAGAAVLILRAIRRRGDRPAWRRALGLYLVVWLLPLAAWSVRSDLVSPPDERTNRGVWLYVDPYDFAAGRVSAAALVERVAAKLPLEAANLLQLLGARTGEGLPGGVALVIVALLVLPLAVSRWRRGRADPLSLYVLLYLLTYGLWPFHEGTRFMLPILPVVWTLALETTVHLPVPRRALTGVLGVVLVLIGGLSLKESLRVLPAVRMTASALGDGRVAESGAMRAGLWLREKTPTKATFMTFPGSVEAEISGRKLLAAPTTSDPDRLLRAAREADYIVARDSARYSQAALLAVAREHPGLFRLAARLGDRFIFERLR